MDLIRIERMDTGVTLVTLDDGKVNTLGTRMVEELGEAAAQLSGGRGSVVLTGGGRCFSSGLDLKEVLSMDRAGLGAFVDRFEDMCLRWIALERPVVAAVNGHAIAGGLVVALMADLRLVARGELRMGLTELPLGIALPTAVLELVGLQCNPAAIGEVVMVGSLHGPDEAVRLGLASRAVDPERLLPEALELAARMGQAPGPAFARTKQRLRRDAISRIEAGRNEGREQFLDSFFEDEVRRHLQGALEALAAKKKSG